MNQITRFSVVVPFFNCQRYLEKCIQALLEQTYPSAHYEVIMVDNNSTDDSARIVRKYPRIRLLSELKQGAYAARNLGVSSAGGDVIAFTDPDCVPAPDWLNNLDMAMRNPEVLIVLGAHEFAADSLSLRLLQDYQDAKNHYVFQSRIRTAYYGHANNMAVRRTLFDELGPFEEIPRGADTVMVRRCIDRHSCEAVCYSDAARVRHLEITSVQSYFRKVYIYGQSIRSYGQITRVRPMTNRERLVVFRKTVNAQHYSLARSAHLLSLLFLGWLCWISAGIKAGRNGGVQ